MVRLLSSILVLSLTFAAGCSSESNPNPVAQGGAGGGGGGGNGGEGALPLAGTTNNGAGECAQTVRPANDDFCHVDKCDEDLACNSAKARPVENCCVLVGEPGRGQTATLERSTDTNEFFGTGKPDVSCFDPANYPPKPDPSKSETVTMKGVVKAFSNGCDLVGVKVEVFKVRRTGDPATDGELGDMVGSAVVTDDMSTAVEESDDKCPDDLVTNRAYEYPDVPTQTELVVVTSGNTPADGWRPLYQYNTFIWDGDPDYDAGAKEYSKDLRALADTDFQTIPTVAIGSTISAGNGAVGGEVHDCGNVRVQNARVDINVARRDLVYFSDDEENPLPDIDQKSIGTGRTAIYSALDVKPGFARVSATGLIEEGGKQKLVSLGYYDVRVFKDAVTSVTFKGLQPHQVP